MGPYHDQPEYSHRGYYRGRGRGRYQSVVRKAIGRIGPPGGQGADGPPSYYNADSYSSNRYFIRLALSSLYYSVLLILYYYYYCVKVFIKCTNLQMSRLFFLVCTE